MWGLLFFSNLFINRLLGVLLKDCYDSSSALGCGQQSAQREESQAAASEWPGPASGPGWAAHAQWRPGGRWRPAVRQPSGQCQSPEVRAGDHRPVSPGTEQTLTGQ